MRRRRPIAPGTSGLLAAVGILISACAPASFPLPGIDALGDDGPVLAATQDNESVDDSVGLPQVDAFTGHAEPPETPQVIEATGVPDVTPDLPEEAPVPMVDMSATATVAANIGALPTPTCAQASPVVASATFPTNWLPCFEKPWPKAYGSFSPSNVISLPKQRVLLIGADAISSLPHRLLIVDSNLTPACQPDLPWKTLAKAEGNASSSPVDIKSHIRFVRAAKDRLFVAYEHANLYKPVIAEYDFDCKMLFLRKGYVEDGCGDCPGYPGPGVAFASAKEGSTLTVTAYDRKGQVVWKTAVPSGVEGSLLTLGSEVAVRLKNGSYLELGQNGDVTQVFPGAILGADDASWAGWGIGSDFIALGSSGAIASGPKHYGACGLLQWSRNFEPCGNGVVLCEVYDVSLPSTVHTYLAGHDDFGWRIVSYASAYEWGGTTYARSISSISPHGRLSNRVDVAYGGEIPRGGYFLNDGSSLTMNELGLIRANRLGSTTCKGCGPPAPDCSDSDPCTKDSCDPSLGDCVHEPIAGCVKPKGACFTTDDCDDANPCTTDTCDKPSGACSYAANAVENCKTGVWKTDAELAGWVNPPDWYPSDGWLSPVKSVRPQLHEAPDGGLVVVDEWEVRRYMQKGKQRYTRALPEPAGASALAPDAGVVLYVRQPEGKEVAGKSRFLRLKPTGQIAQDATIDSGLVDWILPDTWMERKRWLLAKPGGGGYQFVGRKSWTSDTWHARVIHLSEALTATATVELALPGIVGGDVPQTRGIEALWAGKDGALLVGWRKKGAKGPEFGAAAFDVAGKLLWSKGLLTGKVAVDAGFDLWRPQAFASAASDDSAYASIDPSGLVHGKPLFIWPAKYPLGYEQAVDRHTSFSAAPGGLAFRASFTAEPGKPPSANDWKASLQPSPQWLVVAEQAKKKLVEFNKLCEQIENESGPCPGGPIGCCSMNNVPFKCNEPIATILARDNHAILDVHVLSTGWTALLVGSSPAYPNYGVVVMLDKDFRFASSGATFPAWWLNWTAGGKFMSGCHPTKGSTWDVCCAQSD